MLGQVESWGRKGGYAMAEPLFSFGNGDSQSTHLRRYLVITRHHIDGAKATYEVATSYPKPSNCLPEQLP